MARKTKFKWEKLHERSLAQIVAEDGVMSTREILHIAQRLCALLDGADGDEAEGERRLRLIHPQTVFVDQTGEVRLLESDSCSPLRRAYLPPELGRGAEDRQTAEVYALGMLMLFMASAQEKKAALDGADTERPLRELIARCIALDAGRRYADIHALAAALARCRKDSRRTLSGLATALALALGAVLIFAAWQGGEREGGLRGAREGYAEGYAAAYEKGFADAPGIGLEGAVPEAGSGNLSGNLAAEKGALAAFGEGALYFLAEQGVCRMDPYTGAVEVLRAEHAAYGLSFYEGKLFYSADGRVYSLDPASLKRETVCDSHAGLLYFSGGEIYLHDRSDSEYLYRIEKQTGALTQVSGALPYRCLNIVGERLYFIDPLRENNLYSSALNGENLRLLSSHHCDSFSVYGDRIYVSISQSAAASGMWGGERLLRMDLNGGGLETLSRAPVRQPVATQSGVFFAAGRDGGLQWISADGGLRYTLTDTRCGHFSVVGRWIIFRNEEDGGRLWRVRIDGSDEARLSP